MQAVEEVPSSSASSVTPSAATTPAAAKTAASIQELNVEQEPGWIFGVMGGSVASITIGTDDLWDELVLDSGSVSTACPYAWCSHISLNYEDKVHLQDIQQRRIPSHGSRVVPLKLWGPEDCVDCKGKFDVADVAYPVVSLGKMIESGFTFRFDDYKCYVHKGNQRVEIFPKGRIFVLRNETQVVGKRFKWSRPLRRLLQKKWKLMTMEKEQELQELNHVRMNLEMNHHHRDHVNFDRVQCDQELSSVRSNRSGQPDGDMVDRSGKPDERSSSSAQIRTLLDEQRQMIIAEYCEEIGHHELQAARAEEESRILREELWRQQMDFREVHQQSLTEMEELRKFQSSTFDTLARRKLIEDQNTILELSGRVQELQNEVICMNDSKDFQDAESIRSGNSHVTSRPVSFPPHPIPEGMWRPSFVSPRRKEGPPCIWDTHGISGNVFANPRASSSAPYPQELNPWGTTIEEPLHMSTAEKSERPEQNQDLRCQSGPSAKDSVIFSGGDSL